jgi:hypothetical protein
MTASDGGAEALTANFIGDFMGRLLFGFSSAVLRRVSTPLFALLIAASATIAPVEAVLAQDQKPAANAPVTPADVARESQKKADDFVEAAQAINGPAGNPECVWLGRRVVVLMWRDDLDTAFRHLDLYDRFGCPGGHVQATFRCLVKFGPAIDPRVADSLNRHVHGCWINPNAQPQPAALTQPGAPAAATPAPAQPEAKPDVKPPAEAPK